MFPTYNSLAEVPEAFREHYVMRSGKAVAEVSTDHPLVVNNATLLSQKEAAETAKTEAERKKAEAESALASANVLPRGHVAIPKAEADLLEKVKAKGTAEEVTAMLDDYPNLKAEKDRTARAAHLREVANVLGFEPEAFIRLPNLPEFDLRDTSEKDAKGNPKKTAIAKITGENNTITEKPGREYVEAHEDYKPFLAALKPAQAGTSVHGSVAGGSTTAPNEYDEIRDEVKGKKAATQPKDPASILAALGGQPVAATN